MKHPFKPLLNDRTKTLLVGTLPPESAPFYFSNSPNTRLWDILKSIVEEREEVVSGSNSLSAIEKEKILTDINTGIYDIILEYERDIMDSTKDKHIQPKKYPAPESRPTSPHSSFTNVAHAKSATKNAIN